MTLEEIRARMAPRRAGFQDVTGEYAVLVPLVESPASRALMWKSSSPGSMSVKLGTRWSWRMMVPFRSR